MKYLKMLGIAAVAAMSFAAFAASASATTLEVGGTAKNEKVEITSSLLSGSSTELSRTDGSLANECSESHVNGSTESPYTGSKVTGSISSLSFSSCIRPVTVHKAGKLYVEHIASTTNGTVSSEEAEVTVGSPFGTLNCKTSAGVDIGTLTGKKEGNATLDVNAVLNCGFLVPSASWKGTYEVTSPAGLGVTDETPPPPTTTLEVGGTPKGEPVEITASLETGTLITLSKTDGSIANACDTSHVHGTTSVFTGSKVTGALSALTFESCTRPVTVHKAGKLYVEHIASTTNGTVSSEEAEVTVSTPFGTVNCKTGEGTDIGTLTGVKEGNATIDINAVLNCGVLLPSATWKGSYTVTSPSGLGVTDKAPPASTLEVGGTPKKEKVEITASLKSGTSLALSKTDGSFANVCDTSHVHGTTSVFTGKVTGALSTLTFENCTRPVTVHKAGELYVEHISSTTNGTVSSEEAEVTVGTPFGTVNCKTDAGTDIGTLTGVKEGNATLDINAVLNCGVLLPSATWKGSYTVTSPSGLGVTTA